ncbi:uncharacterized protein C1orf115 [Chanos chanos]|uniref:Uncharacterized protein C1orf115 n=1 Tax=Chanos chanos TaxID=29144 RepID=A0A6J2WEE8_CHACN|nr:uncharacterized protein C1orf115 homolog [Chanos chanos]
MKPKPVIFESMETLGVNFHDRTTRYRRQVDTDTSVPGISGNVERNDQPEDKRAREIHFAFLPERYEPLVEEDDRRQTSEEKKRKKKDKFKKYRKNMRKALRYSWKCLMFSLQSLTVGYSTPLSAAATLFPEFYTRQTRS